MTVLAASVGAPENAAIRSFLADRRRRGEEALRRRLEKGAQNGELPAASVGKLTKFYNAVLQGMSVQARDGADSATLNDIVDAALEAWPSDQG